MMVSSFLTSYYRPAWANDPRHRSGSPGSACWCFCCQPRRRALHSNNRVGVIEKTWSAKVRHRWRILALNGKPVIRSICSAVDALCSGVANRIHRRRCHRAQGKDRTSTPATVNRSSPANASAALPPVITPGCPAFFVSPAASGGPIGQRGAQRMILREGVYQ